MLALIIGSIGLLLGLLALIIGVTTTRHIGKRDPVAVPQIWRKLLRIKSRPVHHLEQGALPLEGRERIDLRLSSSSAEPCQDYADLAASMIWLRFDGVTIAPEVQHAEVGKPGPTSVHYQIRQEGRWASSGHAAALVRVQGGKQHEPLEGVLSVCFADRHDSCASGSFKAVFCRDPLIPDVRDMVEPASD